MESNKGQTIFLSVIGIATLLVAIVGATFAWFSTGITGSQNAETSTVTTATVGAITIVNATAGIGENLVKPGWVSDGSQVSVTTAGITGDLEVPYSCKLTGNVPTGTDNTEQFKYCIADTNSSTGCSWLPLAGVSDEEVISGTLSSTHTGTTKYLFLTLVEKGEVQTGQGATITASVTCTVNNGQDINYKTNQ